MMAPDQVIDTVAALLDASIHRRDDETWSIVREVVRGPKYDSWAVAATLASALGEGMQATGPDGMHVLRVQILDGDGNRREGDADDLTPPLRAFARMVAALNNGDRQLAKDVFIAYVGEHSINAVRLIGAGLRLLVHKVEDVASGKWPESTMPVDWLLRGEQP